MQMQRSFGPYLYFIEVRQNSNTHYKNFARMFAFRFCNKINYRCLCLERERERERERGEGEREKERKRERERESCIYVSA